MIKSGCKIVSPISFVWSSLYYILNKLFSVNSLISTTIIYFHIYIVFWIAIRHGLLHYPYFYRPSVYGLT